MSAPTKPPRIGGHPNHTPPTKPPGTGDSGGGHHHHHGGGDDDQMGQKKQNAFDTFIGILEQYGFAGNNEIAKAVRKMILDGVTDFQQIELGLRDTDAWKKRFAGNEIRLRDGLNVLSVSEYLSTEKSMSEILHTAGLPSGFYDDPHDFAKWIGGSVSPAELQSRVSIATDLKNREDPAVLAELRRRGLDEGDILAHFLDEKRALPILQKKYQSTLIGAAARRAGADAGLEYADKLAGMGITEQQAAAGYGTVAEIAPTLAELGDVYGEKYNQRNAEKEVFENDADSARKRKRISGQESASFSGSSGQSQSALTRSSAGSY